jgi:hypothetical protein
MPPIKITAAERQRQRYPNSFLILIYNPSGKHKDRFSIDGTSCIYAGQDKSTLYDNLLSDNNTPAYIFRKLSRRDDNGNYHALIGRAVNRTNPQVRATNIPPEYHCTIQPVEPTDILQKLPGLPEFTAANAKSRSWCKEKLLNDYGLIKLSGNYDQGIILVAPLNS